MNDRTPQAPPPELVASRVQELAALEASDPTSFAEELADNIMEPDAVDTVAFRSDELAFKSLAAASYLLDRSAEQIRRHRQNSERQRRTVAFRHKVIRERRVLENIVNGLRAKRGILPNAPNPRRRAQQALWNEAMKGDPIPAGRWRELLNEEIERDKERKREAKKARRDARRRETGR